MHSDDEHAASAVSGSSTGDTTNGGNVSNTRGTIAAMWGRNNELPLSKADKDAPKAAPRKRRRKDEASGAAQGRLVFSANGMSVATPPPAPVPDPALPGNAATEEDKASGTGNSKGGTKRKARGNRKLDDRDDKPARRRGARPSQKMPGPNSDQAPSRTHVVSLSDSSGDDDEDVMILGGTPPAPMTGQEDDPVVVDAPRGPRKIVFAADTTRPAHAFFSRPAPMAASAFPVADSSSTPASGQPSATASGTATPTSAPNGKGSVHSFFLNGSGAPGTLRKGWGGSWRAGEEPPAPLPGDDWPSHVESSNVSSSASTSAPRRPPRPRRMPSASGADGTFWSNATPSQRPQLNSGARSRAACPSHSTPAFGAEHSAIDAVRGDKRADDARETWCERHRPRRAAEVLGNEQEAEYLRDWLQALSVGAGGERKIVRRVPRRRLANPDTSWIVDDLGLFGQPEDEFDADDDMPEPYDEPPLWPGQRPNTYPPLGAFVGNTIVLTGPCGTGKSAAVHAVADELGWDVFEVYPGIGRRTSTNLFSLVGEVGKNHMVGSRDQKDKKPKKSLAADAARAMFAKAKPPAGSQGSAADPIELDLDDAEAPSEPQPIGDEQLSETEEGGASSRPAQHKQSLILIDEADILFEEETTFWPAVVSLIADSRRPVVITCNDLSAVPTDMLPLQVILHFRPPPSHTAQAYLDAIARKHGVCTNIARLYAECSSPCHPDLVGAPLPPNGNEPQAHFDLRAAISQMQLDRNFSPDRCDCSVPNSDSATSGDEPDMDVLSRGIDAVSFADAFVGPRPWEQMETAEIDHLEPGADDQHGVHLLLKPDVQDLHPALAAYSRGADMAGTLAMMAGPLSLASDQTLHHAQITYVRGLLPLLDPLVPLSARLLPHPSLFLELLPSLRMMVAADDAFEVADRAAAAAGDRRINPRTGRAVRNTAQGYERWIDLDTEALAVGRAPTLNLAW